MKFLDKLKLKKNKDNIDNLSDMPELKDDETVIESLDIDDTPERNVRGYDTYYKKKINKKKLIYSVLIITLVILLIFGSFALVKVLNYKGPTDVKEETKELTEMEKIASTIKSTLSQNYEIGKTTKTELLESGIEFHQNSTDNYLIKKEYTQINEIDHLTTFIFEKDILIAVIHEALLDNTTKYSLSTYFQNFSSYINISFPNIETSERWFEEPQIYNVENWNKSVINNNLELTSEFNDEKNYVKVVASGIPYVDFLMSTRNDQNFGNVMIFYTNKDNSEKFKILEDINFN